MGLNHRHCDFQSHALPTELLGHTSEPPEGQALNRAFRRCPARFHEKLPLRGQLRGLRRDSFRPASSKGRGRGIPGCKRAHSHARRHHRRAGIYQGKRAWTWPDDMASAGSARKAMGAPIRCESSIAQDSRDSIA